ncbi:HAD family hydrolase [Thermocrispum municipale]|jgi:HAD superfamily hydrolase (TIGR01509 family)|uniref:HAD family hydrolase n=1 Tax=Thermocrispum municipale TaxID=37926 RepID=UPI00040C5937|nr:HAD family phosphatase [Thermocrispum municipale]
MEFELPDAVLWDMDGTLVDTEKLWEIALGELAEHLGGRLSREARAKIVGTNSLQTMRLLFADLGRELTDESYAEANGWLEARMHELFSGDIPWRPGAVDALQMVRETGLPTALVTSTVRPLAERALDHIGRRWFDVTVAGDEVDGKNKPHPRPYLRAAELLGVEPGRCVAIEDSPVGSSAAAAAGCGVIVVPNDVPVEPGPSLLVLETLAGLRPDDLSAAFRLAQDGRQARSA